MFLKRESKQCCSKVKLLGGRGGGCYAERMLCIAEKYICFEIDHCWISTLLKILCGIFVKWLHNFSLHAFSKSKNDESYLLDPEKKVKRYDNIMKDDLESSNNKNEDSFLTLSATSIIVTSPSTTSVCYFQMVESDTAFLSNQIGNSTFKEKWQRSKFRSLVSYVFFLTWHFVWVSQIFS